MSPLTVHIKHAGKIFDLQLDPDLPPSVFKDTVYQVTGVPPDRMKVMVKGGVLKVSILEWTFVRLRFLIVWTLG
jgi:ubiquitin carboxyl-terminal hydrolase 14